MEQSNSLSDMWRVSGVFYMSSFAPEGFCPPTAGLRNWNQVLRKKTFEYGQVLGRENNRKVRCKMHNTRI